MTNVSNIKGATVKPGSKNAEGRIAGVEFKNCDCNSRLLHQAMEKLDDYSGFDQADFSRFCKIKAAFDSQTKEVTRVWNKLLEKHCEMEPIKRKNKETGEMEPVMKPNGKPAMRPKQNPNPSGRGMDFAYKDRKAFFVEYKALMMTPFHVDAYRLLMADMIKAGLTPKEVRACAKIISDIDPELIQDAQVFDEDEEDELNEFETDADDTPPGPIPGSSVDSASEAPNVEAGASNP